MKEETLRQNRLYCPLGEKEHDLSFSLVDYYNSYYTSDDPKKIIRFYDSFENADQLIQWMRERPKGVHTIYEVDGDKDIIVVIPTADFNGKFAKECRGNIFRGLHIVFVESGRDDFYFNYAHNCNLGIKKAMEYNPDWIVVSNDDVVKIDEPSVLVDSLGRFDKRQFSSIFTETSNYHSYPVLLGYPNWFRMQYFKHSTRTKKLYQLLECKYGVDIVSQGCGSKGCGNITKKLFRSYTTVRNMGAFGIFSSDYIRTLGGTLFDEIYINEFEDVEASYNLSAIRLKTAIIPYRIGDLIGATLGRSTARQFRGIASLVYFNYKVRKGLLKFATETGHDRY